MPKRRTNTAKQAHALLIWLESLALPTRVINALRRDLEVVTGEREGEDGTGILAGFDQARFIEELYQKRGGQLGKVPSVAASAIESLRAAVPATVSGGDSEVAQPSQADTSPERAETVSPADDASQTQNAEAAPEEAVATQEDLPDLADAAPDDIQEQPVASTAPETTVEVAVLPTNIASETVIETAAAHAASKRRGRSPRAAAVATATPEAAEVPEAPIKQREQPSRDVRATGATPAFPPLTHHAPSAPQMEDPSFAVVLRLWRKLHPQGKRAAMLYMADLAIET